MISRILSPVTIATITFLAFHPSCSWAQTASPDIQLTVEETLGALFNPAAPDYFTTDTDGPADHTASFNKNAKTDIALLLKEKRFIGSSAYMSILGTLGCIAEDGDIPDILDAAMDNLPPRKFTNLDELNSFQAILNCLCAMARRGSEPAAAKLREMAVPAYTGTRPNLM